VRRDLIAKGLGSFVGTATEKACGIEKSPYEGQVNPALPYTVIFQLPSSNDPTPTMARRSGTMEFVFQITSVGKTVEQCSWMSGKVYEAILSSDDLPLEGGLSVMSRTLDSFGAILPSGESLFNSADTYRIGVQA